MKTLYTRMVIIFVGVVFISLIVSFVISYKLNKDDIAIMLQKEMMTVGQEIIDIVQSTEGLHLERYLNSIKVFHYYLYFYNESGDYQYYGSEEREIAIPTEYVQRVLNGTMYEGMLDVRNHPEHRVIGFPFELNEQKHALFIQPQFNKFFDRYNEIVFTSLLYVFIIGGLLIALASRHIVKPLKQLTEATKQLAKGNFEVDIDIHHRDEIGALAKSFKHMAQELRQIEQMRQDFVSNVSHEIQSPLTSIRGFSKALKENVIPESERIEYLGIIEAESERLSKLSENLLKIASLDSDQHPLEKTSYQLDEQIRKIVVFMEPQWAAKHIEIDISLPRVKVCADQNLFDQVWINILSNSIKFTPDGGSITIGMSLRESNISVIISDTGIGISKEDIESIFLRFYMADKSRDRKKTGNGLGLAIVNKIVTLHNGEVKVNSELTEGTTIEVVLPLE